MTTLSAAQIAADLSAQGAPSGSLSTMTAIALAESGGNTQATHTNTDGSIDRGLFQINNRWHPDVTDACAFDPVCATQAALKISNGGTSFGAWSTYTSGAYLHHMPSATDLTGSFQNYAGYAFGQCTYFVAKSLSWVPGGWIKGNWGNAKDWAQNAQAQGYTVSSTPVAGAIAVWDGSANASSDGHVAIVQSVANGIPTVQEMNVNGNNVVDTRTIADTRGIVGYILPPAGAQTQAQLTAAQSGGSGGVASAISDATGLTNIADAIKNGILLFLVGVLALAVIAFGVFVIFRRDATAAAGKASKLAVVAGGV